MDFSDSIVACEVKVDLCNQLTELLKKIMVIKGHGDLVTYIMDASDSVFLTSFK